MPDYYVRRGKRIAGPFSGTKLREAVAAGKVSADDEIAEDPAGPWTPISKTKLRDTLAEKTAIASPRPAELIIPTDPPSAPNALQSSLQFAFRVSNASWGIARRSAEATGRMLSTRAQRKHELAMAKIQAEAAAKANQTPAQQSASPVAFANTTVVNVVQQNNQNVRGSSGCSGCLGCLGILFIGFVLLMVLAPKNRPLPPRSVPPIPSGLPPAVDRPAADAPRAVETPESPAPTVEPAQPNAAADEVPESKPPAADESQIAERRARGDLELGRQFFRKGRDETGRQWMQDLIKKYPNTKAATDAQAILDGTSKP